MSVLALRRDLEQNFKGVLQAQLAQLDLDARGIRRAGDRAERTREKLAALEKRLAALENRG